MNYLTRVSRLRQIAEATPTATFVTALLLVGLGGCGDTPPVSPAPDPSPSEGVTYEDL